MYITAEGDYLPAFLFSINGDKGGSISLIFLYITSQRSIRWWGVAPVSSSFLSGLIFIPSTSSFTNTVN